MAKEVMIITEDDIKEKLVLGESEIATLKFLVANAGVEMDEETKRAFISSRPMSWMARLIMVFFNTAYSTPALRSWLRSSVSSATFRPR